MIDTSKFTVRAGDYGFAPSGGVTDRTLLDIATQYENQVSRKMASLLPDQLPKRYVSDERVLVTTKYDGEGVFLFYDRNGGSFIFNAPSGLLRVGLPVTAQLEQRLKSRNVQKGLFRAELYLPHERDGSKRATVADVIRISFAGVPQELASLRLAIFDVIMLDGKDMRRNLENFEETWTILGELFGEESGGPFHRVRGSIIPEREAASVFKRETTHGDEGLVIRRLRRVDIAKVKPHLAVDALVIGYVEGEFEGKYGVTSLLTALNYPERQNGKQILQTFCRVGSGFSDQQREELLATLSSQKVPAPLAMTDSDGRTVNFVAPKHIAELHGEDLVAMSGKEKENRSQVFCLNGAPSPFSFLGLTAFPRLTFATFHQLRSDKSLNTGGARIEQVLQDPKLPALRNEVHVKPAIARREVYMKGDAVRKLVVLRTAGESAMPYLVYWTDFSPKRKEPLKVSVQCARTPERMEALVQQLLEENVTKGFIRTDGQPPAAKGEQPSAANSKADEPDSPPPAAASKRRSRKQSAE